MRNLDKLTIKGFKSIRELDGLEFKNLNVVVGANGAGKSNLIEFFRMMAAMMKLGGLREYIAGNADAYLYGGPKCTPKIEVSLVFGKNGYDFELTPTEDGFFLINNERRYEYASSTDDSARAFPGGSFDPRLSQDEVISQATRSICEAIRAWKIYHVHDTSSMAGMRRYSDMAHNETLFPDASNIAPFLFRLKSLFPESYRKIVETVRLVIPFFDDFILQPNEKEMMRLNWRQKGLNDYPMRPTQLSDGSIRFICLATALLQPLPPSTIFIDEPELGLHPAAIEMLAELIQLASKRTQVVIATQSPLLMNQFGINDIIVTTRKDGATTFERLREADFTEWLKDYSVGELWTKNVIAGGPVHE